MEAVFCPECEAENHSDNLFCDKCAHQLAEIPRVNRAEPPASILLPEIDTQRWLDTRAEYVARSVKPRADETAHDAYLSLVFGIVGLLLWPFGIVALTRGYKAQEVIKKTGQLGGGMAQAGITLGWVDVGFGVVGMLLLMAL